MILLISTCSKSELSCVASNIITAGGESMKVFLSWSGDRAKAMAEYLHNWLPDVIQAIDPWVSSQSISQGSRPLPSIADELSGCNFGIVCVTPESRGSAWVNFEAGALSKVLEESVVVPLLLDIEKAQVTGPLSQFQMTIGTDRDEVFKLVSDMNKNLGESKLAPDRLVRSFEQNWPKLETEFNRIAGLQQAGVELAHQKRSADDRLDEVLLLARQQDRRLSALERSLATINLRSLDAINLGTGNKSTGRWPVSKNASSHTPQELPEGEHNWQIEEKERQVVDLIFNQLGKYNVTRVSYGTDSINATVEEFPNSDTALAAEFRDTVGKLAEDIQRSVTVSGPATQKYTHAWPF
ncbi:toll/interleukin-1 receptor domain-containing protein [Streptomyces sp. NPDC090088]|uniref:toll/interleukin-1 receptor domain-containing protein n=1 Tax=Streptomyces sp. NPDC090088 TaxID=3365944 RepID=UPI0037FCA9BF